MESGVCLGRGSEGEVRQMRLQSETGGSIDLALKEVRLDYVLTHMGRANKTLTAEESYQEVASRVMPYAQAGHLASAVEVRR